MKRFIKDVKDVITHRLFVLSTGIIIAFCILFLRLFQIEIIEEKMHQEELSASILREVSIPAPRGIILDRYSKPLATNKVAFVVNIDPSIEVENQDEILLNLVNMLEENGDNIIDEFPISKQLPFKFIGTEENVGIDL